MKIAGVHPPALGAVVPLVLIALCLKPDMTMVCGTPSTNATLDFPDPIYVEEESEERYASGKAHD